MGLVYFQRYHCLSLSVAYRYLRKEWNTDIKNELSNLGYCQKSLIQFFFLFFVSCLRLGLLFEACSTNADLGSAKKCQELLILAILAQAVGFFCP